MAINRKNAQVITAGKMAARGANLSSRSFAAGVHVVENIYTPRRKQERHAHLYTNVSLVLAGSVEETVGRVLEQAFALSVVVKPGDTEHANLYGSKGARILSVLLDPELATSIGEWESGILRWRWVHGGTAAHWMLRLLRIYRQCPTRRSGEIEDCIYEVLASLSGSKSSGTPASPPHWLGLVRQEIDDTFADTPRVRDLAKNAGLHPVYLARRFRSHIGCSVTDYRTFLKARAAAELLASSDLQPIAVANQCGFADQSHLCRVFKRASGLTPLNYRRLTKGSNPVVLLS